MIAFVELVTGMEPNVLFVQQILTGMVKHVLLAAAVEFGIVLISSVNAQLIHNGMETHVLKLVLMERYLKTVSAFAQLVNSKIMENASTIQFAKMELNGMVNNVLEYHVFQELHIQIVVVVAKPQYMPVLLVPIGMATDVFM
jgi:hypothetical protein